MVRLGARHKSSRVGQRRRLTAAGRNYPARYRSPRNCRPYTTQTADRTILVHTGCMAASNKTVRQSVSLPQNVAAQVRRLAKTRKLSANRMLVELIENGIEAEKRKQEEFFDLAERFRAAGPDEAKRLGDQLGRMVFGG